MPLKIVRNDITRMECDAVVNTAASVPADTFDEVGAGCDRAIYRAAGADALIAARKKIGILKEGEAAVTPAFALPAKYIIHAVSPVYIDGNSGEEERLRNCYRNSLRLALENGARSVAFPLIATGSFGYPQEEGMRIAVDEINAFLLAHEMQVYLVVFGTKAAMLGRRIDPGLEAYIDRHYVEEKREEEYGAAHFDTPRGFGMIGAAGATGRIPKPRRREKGALSDTMAGSALSNLPQMPFLHADRMEEASADVCEITNAPIGALPEEFSEAHESRLEERMRHMSDTFSEYLMYLIEQKGKNPVDVYKRAIVDKKVFSKIKNNPEHHPNKMTAMCLCVGAELNLDEARDLLARAGYALSPCDKTDVIFSYFLENRIYDMIELDIQLEEHGLKCLIS